MMKSVTSEKINGVEVKVLVLQSIKDARITLDKNKNKTIFLDFLKT